MGKEELEEYWNHVALEAEDFGKTLRVHKWKRAARNWLADYADRRAHDFVSGIVDEIIRIKRSARVLDVGCGPGKWTILFAKRCSSTTAIDISPNMIVLAKENAKRHNLKNIDFHIMNAATLSLPDGAYDLVNCVTVLQHIFNDDDWEKAVHEMVRVAKIGGFILLFETAPNYAIRKRTRHVSVRTMQQYVREFERAGAFLVYWRAADLSLPITFFGLKNYAASFNKKVYYFMSKRRLLPVSFLSFVSWVAARLAGLIDYRLAETPLSYLSTGRILLFRRAAA